jgi:hypothetical protein
MWSRAHICRILWHPWLVPHRKLAILYHFHCVIKLGHDKLSKCRCNIVCCGHHGHKKVTKINCELYQATSSSDALAIMLAIVQMCVHVTLVKNAVHVKICIGEGR